MSEGIRFFSLPSASLPHELECGVNLNDLEIAYETYGQLNPEGTNAVLICHALTGDAHAAGPLKRTEALIRKVPAYRALKPEQPGWWDGAIGPGRAIDTNRYFVVCSNIAASCYGTSGPLSINPETGDPYHDSFPQVTVRDMVRIQYELLKNLGISEVHSVIGGSLGGMQALEWAVMYPEMVRAIIPIATSAQHSPWAIAMNHVARSAILNDPEYRAGNFDPEAIRGLGVARQIGMISYRSDVSFLEKFSRERLKDNGAFFDPGNLFQVENYLNYQGQKLMKRFDPNSYILLSRALDLHDVARDRGPVAGVLDSIKAKTLCIGIDSDVLYPAWEQKDIASKINRALYSEIKSNAGHDAFLIEFDQLEAIIKPFLASLS